VLSARYILVTVCTSVLVRSFACYGEPHKTLEEKIPAEVRAEVQNQVRDYFGSENLKGLPLLDSSIDWSDLNNWPDEFVFKSRKYRMQLVEWRGDYGVMLKSRQDAKLGITVHVLYYPTIASKQKELHIFAGWNKGGSICEKYVSFPYQTFPPGLVFGYEFYPSEELYSFDRVHLKDGAHLTDYFDRFGKNRGGARNDEYLWEGVKIGRDLFYKNTDELFNSHRP